MNRSFGCTTFWCTPFRGIAGPVAVAAGALACAGCSTASSGAAPAASSGPCDPLAPTPVTLGTILGVGKDTHATIYVSDEADSGQQRVFVSNGDTLYRKEVAGSGQMGSPPDTDYTFSFRDPLADASDTRALLIQMRAGAVTAMALGPGNSRSFLGASAGQEPLTVLDAGAVAGFKLQNLPGTVVYVADVSGGDAIVITAPMDAWGSGGFRLFYGAPRSIVERPITSYRQALSGGAVITFAVGTAMYTLQLTVEYDPDGGLLGRPGPVTLDTGSGAPVPVTLRLPTPTSLSGFSFTCLAP